MTLCEKIITIYPELQGVLFINEIILQDDGNGEYIAKWEHPTLARPTQEQLDGVK
jgi:hypothetical protein